MTTELVDTPLGPGAPATDQLGTVQNWVGSHPLPENISLLAGLTPDEAIAGGPQGASHLPKVGDRFAGFDIVAVLGRGTFGRVYLARQGDLAFAAPQALHGQVDRDQ